MATAAAALRPHVAILPSPGIGHLIPLAEFAKVLVHRHGYAVTFITAEKSDQVESFITTLPPAVTYIPLPTPSLDDLPPGCKAEVIICLTMARSRPYLHRVLGQLKAITRLVAFVTDLFGVDAFDVAHEVGVPKYVFFPSNAMALQLFHHLRELDETNECEYRDMALLIWCSRDGLITGTTLGQGGGVTGRTSCGLRFAMEKTLATLKKGAACCGWNYCGQRLAVGYCDGTVSVHDPSDPGSLSSSSLSLAHEWKAHTCSIVNVVWVPPDYGDAVSCISADGTISLWEEVQTDTEPLAWKLCALFESSMMQVLDLQFGIFLKSMKMVVAYADGHVKVYEFSDPLELKKWQLQAEFQNVTDSVPRFGKASCKSASIAWNPRKGEAQQSAFVLGFNADIPEFNTAKVWEFDEAHQRWLVVAELALPGDNGDRVHSVAWAPNIGRPYEIIAVATCKGIAIWHVALDTLDGRPSTEKVALLSGHDGEVWQLDWDMSGMTLASAGGDGMVRLWQSNLNGVWHEQAALES